MSGQQAPKPDIDTAALAWDRGDYAAALTAYKTLLAAPGGEQWLETIALQTGELFQTREITPDGANPRFSPDGRFVAYETGSGTSRHTRVAEPGSGMRLAAEVKGHSLGFLPQGDRVVYLKLQPSEELTQAQAELEKAGQTPARFARTAAAELAAVQARRHRHAKPLDRAGAGVSDRWAAEVGRRFQRGRTADLRDRRPRGRSVTQRHLQRGRRLRPPRGRDEGAGLQGRRRSWIRRGAVLLYGRVARTRLRGRRRPAGGAEPLPLADAAAAPARAGGRRRRARAGGFGQSGSFVVLDLKTGAARV